jgi:hypothetical protein
LLLAIFVPIPAALNCWLFSHCTYLFPVVTCLCEPLSKVRAAADLLFVAINPHVTLSPASTWWGDGGGNHKHQLAPPPALSCARSCHLGPQFLHLCTWGDVPHLLSVGPGECWVPDGPRSPNTQGAVRTRVTFCRCVHLPWRTQTGQNPGVLPLPSSFLWKR